MSNGYQDTIVEQTDLYTIATSTELGPAIPYKSLVHEDGRVNHGFTDYREHPELVDEIPEAAGKPGLLALLHILNDHNSVLMSLGCENDLFDAEFSTVDGPAVYIGGYIDVGYRDAALATEAKLLALSVAIMAHRKPLTEEWTKYELIVQPMKHFFGKAAHNLQLKILAYGPDAPKAWANFNAQCAEMAKTFERLSKTDC